MRCQVLRAVVAIRARDEHEHETIRVVADDARSGLGDAERLTPAVIRIYALLELHETAAWVLLGWRRCVGEALTTTARSPVTAASKTARKAHPQSWHGSRSSLEEVPILG